MRFHRSVADAVEGLDYVTFNSLYEIQSKHQEQCKQEMFCSFNSLYEIPGEA